MKNNIVFALFIVLIIGFGVRSHDTLAPPGEMKSLLSSIIIDSRSQDALEKLHDRNEAYREEQKEQLRYLVNERKRAIAIGRFMNISDQKEHIEYVKKKYDPEIGDIKQKIKHTDERLDKIRDLYLSGVKYE